MPFDPDKYAEMVNKMAEHLERRTASRRHCTYRHKTGYAEMACGNRIGALSWDNGFRFCPFCGGKMKEAGE